MPLNSILLFPDPRRRGHSQQIVITLGLPHGRRIPLTILLPGHRKVAGPIMDRLLKRKNELLREQAYRDTLVTSLVTLIDNHSAQCSGTDILSDRLQTREAIEANTRLISALPRLDDSLIQDTGHIVQDLHAASLRLIGTDQELYNEFDRLRSEADFRLALGLPSMVLTAVIAQQTSPFAYIALTFSLTLIVLGRRSHLAAFTALAQWIAADRVRPPAMVSALEKKETIGVSFDEGHYFVAHSLFRYPNQRDREWLTDQLYRIGHRLIRRGLLQLRPACGCTNTALKSGVNRNTPPAAVEEQNDEVEPTPDGVVALTGHQGA